MRGVCLRLPLGEEKKSWGARRLLRIPLGEAKTEVRWEEISLRHPSEEKKKKLGG